MAEQAVIDQKKRDQERKIELEKEALYYQQLYVFGSFF